MARPTKVQKTYGVVAKRRSFSGTNSGQIQLLLHNGVLECTETGKIAHQKLYQLVLDDWTMRVSNSEVEVIRAPSDGAWEASISLAGLEPDSK
jgi:hypothetical protein